MSRPWFCGEGSGVMLMNVTNGLSFYLLCVQVGEGKGSFCGLRLERCYFYASQIMGRVVVEN